MSVEYTLRKVARQRRDIARPRLQHLLHWATWHALHGSDAMGRPMTDDWIAVAESLVQRKLDELAERGVFFYFGIANSFDLGPLPIALRRIDWEGSVALEVEPVANTILGGGRRGDNWRRANELTIDDLSR